MEPSLSSFMYLQRWEQIEADSDMEEVELVVLPATADSLPTIS